MPAPAPCAADEVSTGRAWRWKGPFLTVRHGEWERSSERGPSKFLVEAGACQTS